MENFDIRIGFDSEYDDMIAEIYYKDKFVLMLSQDQGHDNVKIAITSSQEQGFYKVEVPLTNLIEAIEYAQKRLWELRKQE